MDIAEKDLLTVACALTLIAEKCQFQANRTEGDVRASLLESRGHCVSALRVIADARKKAVNALPCSADCASGKHTRTCPYNAVAKQDRNWDPEAGDLPEALGL